MIVDDQKLGSVNGHVFTFKQMTNRPNWAKTKYGSQLSEFGPRYNFFAKRLFNKGLIAILAKVDISNKRVETLIS